MLSFQTNDFQTIALLSRFFDMCELKTCEHSWTNGYEKDRVKRLTHLLFSVLYTSFCIFYYNKCHISSYVSQNVFIHTFGKIGDYLSFVVAP